MVRIGSGDHGGGPKPKDILKVLKMAKSKARKYDIIFDTFVSYRDAILKENLKIRTLKYEIGCELQGDLTNCSELKKDNRLCENLLISTEKFASLAFFLYNLSYPIGDFNQMWEDLLFNQFHDIIGGSAIPEANEDALNLYNSIKKTGNNILNIALGTITNHIDTISKDTNKEIHKNLSAVVVFNPLSWKHQEIVETSITLMKENQEEIAFTVKDYLGNIIPYQIVDIIEEDKVIVFKIVYEATLPPLGFTTFYISQNQEKIQDKLEDLPYFDGNILENKFYKIIIDVTSGNIFQIYDKINNFMVFNSENRGNCLVAIEDFGDSEGKFKQGSDYSPKPVGKRSDIIFSSESLIYGSNVKVVEKGPIRWRIQIVKEYEKSQFIQEIILYRSIQRIDFTMTLDWHDTHKMIKLIFPTSIEQPVITYDSAYCPIERSADGNEHPTQKFVDISNGKFGVALINEGKYAHDVQGSTIGMSVLRSPTEPANNNEEGLHYFRYALYPHSGDFKSANVMQKAYEFNNGVIPYQTDFHPGSLPKNHSFVETLANNIILEVVKKAFESNALILRMYEFHGKSSVIKIYLSFEINYCSETDLLENEIKLIQSQIREL
jgi:alpha-mannosidase